MNEWWNSEADNENYKESIMRCDEKPLGLRCMKESPEVYLTEPGPVQKKEMSIVFEYF